MNITGLALRNLRRRPVRTFLTVASVAIAVAVLFSLLAFSAGYQKSLSTQLQQMGVHLMVVPIGCPYEAASLVLQGGKIDSYLDDSIIAKIAALPSVQIAAPSLMHAIVRPDEGRTDIYLGIDDTSLQLRNWWRMRGTDNKPGPDLFAKPNAVLMGNDAALIEERDTVGEKLWVPEINSEFFVSGILEPTGTQEDGFFYLPLKTAQDKFNLRGKLTAVEIRLTDPTTAAQIGDRLEAMFPAAQVIRMEELLGSIMSLLGSAKALIFSIVTVVIIISGVGVLNTMLMSVYERTQEIGMMRATGAGRTDVFSLIWTETALVSVGGGLLGLGLALLIGPLVEKVARRFVPLSTAQSVLLFEPRTAVICLLVVLLIAVGAGAYPAFRAANGRTIEALRTE
jgi:putative ABC transport system permease protein